MAGVTRGLVNNWSWNVTAGKVRDNFAGLYSFYSTFVTNGSASLIALQTGSSGTGTGYTDDAFPFGENAFAVFKMERPTSGNIPYYVMIQWARGTSFGDVPGDPATLVNGTGGGCGITIVMPTSSLANPWGGTTLANGNDRKSNPVWVTGSAGENLLIFPSTNNPGGRHDGSCQDMNLATPEVVLTHIVGDEDFVCIASDNNGTNSTTRLFYFGPYTPLSGSDTDEAFVSWEIPSIPPSLVQTYGALNASTLYLGGISQGPITGSNRTQPFRFTRWAHLHTSDNNSFSFGETSVCEYNAQLLSLKTNASGAVGTTDNVREAQADFVCSTVNRDGSRAAFGQINRSNSSPKMTIPWGGHGFAPGQSHKSGGQQF